jgi:holo-[acyl-carrier protein] synthase
MYYPLPVTMIRSVGIDLAETERIRKLMERYGDRFLRRLLGPQEFELYRGRHDRHQFVSGRFAAKEAAIKALGRFLTVRPPLHEIQIVNDNTGQPELLWPGHLDARLHEVQAQVSIAHERSHAVAVVVLWEK